MTLLIHILDDLFHLVNGNSRQTLIPAEPQAQAFLLRLPNTSVRDILPDRSALIQIALTRIKNLQERLFNRGRMLSPIGSATS